MKTQILLLFITSIRILEFLTKKVIELFRNRDKYWLKQYTPGLIIFTVMTSITFAITWSLARNTVNDSCDKKAYVIQSQVSAVISSCSQEASANDLLAPLALCAALLLFVLGYFIPSRIRQTLWPGQFSWITLSIICIVVIVYIVIPIVWRTSPLAVNLTLLLGSIYLLILLLLWRWNKTKREQALLQKSFEFANGTVGSDNDNPLLSDLLGFETTAENVKKALLNLNDPVSVVAITGKLGTGKSTFWRIVAEKFEKKNHLHTYISLTQSNSTQDFSKLFAQKWFETLGQRYPILINAPYLEQKRLFDVLRDSSDGILKFIFGTMPVLLRGLFQTITKDGAWEKSSETISTPFVDKTTAKMFYFVPRFHEDRWFVVIDEIERAPFDEVYRVIEVIERFKQVGKYGLPIRLIFVLCVDDVQAKELVKRHKESSEKTSLIHSFLDTGSKLVDRHINVPSVDLNTKLKFIEMHIVNILGNLDSYRNTKVLQDIYNFDEGRFNDINQTLRDHELTDHKSRYDYIMKELANSSPRTIVRVIEQIGFRFDTWMKNYRLTEYLMYEYLTTRYPLVKSLLTTITEKDFDFYQASVWEDRREKATPVERAMDIFEIDMSHYSTKQLDEIAHVLKLFVPRLYKRIWSSGVDHNKYATYEGTLSDKAVVQGLINFRDEQNDQSRFMKVFRQLKTGVWPQLLNDAKLIDDFSGFVRNEVGYEEKSRELSFLIASNIFRYIETTTETLYQPSDINNDRNLLDRLAYELIFQLSASFDRDNINASINLQCISLLENYIKSNAVSYEAKLIFFSAFIDSEGSGLERTMIRKEVIEKLKSPLYFIRLFNAMQKEMFLRYSKPHDNLYQNEAGIHYVLYQSWDGLPKGKSLNLSKLQQIAKVGLSSNTEGLMAFWNVYPYEETWKSYNDFRRDNSSSIFFDPSRRGLFLPLSKLLHYTTINSGIKQLIRQDSLLAAKIEFWRSVKKQYAHDEKIFKPITDNSEATVALKINMLKNSYHISKKDQ